MKIRINHRNSERGTVLMVTLFIAVMFGIFLFSYLNIVGQQKSVVSRSQAWNAALAIAEAGGEEALAQLNPGTPLPAILDRTANGWGNPSGGIYGPVSRSLSGGSYSVCFTTNIWPVIYCTGTVSVASARGTLTRVVRIGTTNVPLFSVALGAKYNLNFNGNNVNTDSFNSYDTNAWTSSTPQGTNGSIASITGVVSVGNANVHGSVYLGPSATDSIKNNGFVTGGTYNDFNADFPDVVLPANTASWLVPLPVPTIVDGVTYLYAFFSSGDYQIMGALSGNIYVGTNATVRLLINGSASPGAIRVAGPGLNSGKLTLYLNGPSFSLSGSSSVDGGVANNLTYLGTSNNTSITMSGNAEFIGTIYAPDANLTLSGGGNNNVDVVGSMITASTTINGHFNFHFDEALLSNGPARAYIANSWGEL
ncbi:MAG TPA: hypothetical protein VG167_01605 [Verrucomicrobiae bacterium]|nr:hypothetical protein [Verrucomicrobiae bacterium]